MIQTKHLKNTGESVRKTFSQKIMAKKIISFALEGKPLSLQGVCLEEDPEDTEDHNSDTGQ